MPTYDGLSHSLNAILGPGASTLLNGQTDSLNAYLIYPNSTGTDYSTSYAYRDAMDSSVILSLCLDLIRDNEYIPIYKEDFTFRVQKKTININATASLSKVYDGLPLMPEITITSPEPAEYDQSIDAAAFSINMSTETGKPYLIDCGTKNIGITVTNNNPNNYTINLNNTNVALAVTLADPGKTTLSVEGPCYINNEYPIIFNFSEVFPIESSTYQYKESLNADWVPCNVLPLGIKQDNQVVDAPFYGVLYTEDEDHNRTYINAHATGTFYLQITNNNYSFDSDNHKVREISLPLNFVKPTIYITYDTSELTSIVYNANKWPHELYDFNFMYYTNYNETTNECSDLIQLNTSDLPVLTYLYESDPESESNYTPESAEALYPLKPAQEGGAYKSYALTITADDNDNYSFAIKSSGKTVQIIPYEVTTSNFTGSLIQYDYYHKQTNAWPLSYNINAVMDKLIDFDNKSVINVTISGDQPTYYTSIKEIGRDGASQSITLVFTYISTTNNNVPNVCSQPIIGTISTSYILQKLSARVIINNSVGLTEAKSAPFAHAQYVVSDSTSLPITDDRWSQVWEDFVLEASDLPSPLVPGNYGNRVIITLRTDTRTGTIPAVTDLYDIHFDTTHALDVVKKTYSSHTITYTKYPVDGLRLDDVLTVKGTDGGVSTVLDIVDPPTLKYGTLIYTLRAVDKNGVYEPVNETITYTSVAPFYSIQIKLAEGVTPVINTTVNQTDFTYDIISREPTTAVDIHFSLTYDGPSTYAEGINIITATAIAGTLPLTMNVKALNISLDKGGSEGEDDGSGETTPITT